MLALNLQDATTWLYEKERGSTYGPSPRTQQRTRKHLALVFVNHRRQSKSTTQALNYDPQTQLSEAILHNQFSEAREAIALHFLSNRDRLSAASESSRHVTSFQPRPSFTFALHLPLHQTSILISTPSDLHHPGNPSESGLSCTKSTPTLCPSLSMHDPIASSLVHLGKCHLARSERRPAASSCAAECQ